MSVLFENITIRFPGTFGVILVISWKCAHKRLYLVLTGSTTISNTGSTPTSYIGACLKSSQTAWVVEWLSTLCAHIFRKSPYFHHKYILLCIFKSEIAHLRQTSFSMPNLHKSNMAAILDISVMFSPILVMADECFILFLGTCISNIIFYHIYCIHTMEPLYIMPLSNHITSIATVLSNSLAFKSRRT